MTTYTVLYASGDAERNLTAEQAAQLVLTHDDYLYEVRPTTEEVEVGEDAEGDPIYEDRQSRIGDDLGWHCVSSTHSRSSGGGAGPMTVIPATYCYARDEAAAWSEIAKIVIAECGNWRRAPQVMTDADYDAMMAEIAADEDAA